MDPYLLQKQIKENASDLQDFCKELKVWGEQMKNEEEHKKNPSKIKEISKAKPSKKKIEKIKEKPVKSCKPIDYSDWDKFDAEAACSKVDRNSDEESDVSDEIDEASLDLAMQQKEKGNKYVKEKNWTEAIKCYTEAIDTYAYDPIFYANRALCFLKLENFKKAEADCTIALKLDKTYVKAYQRRAAAREKLGLLNESKNDLLKVLELEPKNIETKQMLAKLENLLETTKRNEPQRPVSKFTLSRQRKNKIEEAISSDVVAIKDHVKENVEPKIQTVIQAKIDTQKKTPIWPSIPDIKMVKPIYKLPNLRSKKQLNRIDIKEVEVLPELDGRREESKQRDIEKGLKINSTESNDKVTEKKQVASYSKQPQPVQEFVYPRTAVQFANTWQGFDNADLKYEYLRQINGEDISVIFKESLDTKLFSDILETLTHRFIDKSENVYSYLHGLSNVKRFSTLTMFMTSKDKENLTKLMNYLKTTSEVLNEKIENLMQNYNVKC